MVSRWGVWNYTYIIDNVCTNNIMQYNNKNRGAAIEVLAWYSSNTNDQIRSLNGNEKDKTMLNLMGFGKLFQLLEWCNGCKLYYIVQVHYMIHARAHIILIISHKITQIEKRLNSLRVISTQIACAVWSGICWSMISFDTKDSNEWLK